MGVAPPINFTFSDDSLLPKKIGGWHEFSEFACFFLFLL